MKLLLLSTTLLQSVLQAVAVDYTGLTATSTTSIQAHQETFNPVIVQVSCDTLDLAALDADGQGYVAQALGRAYNAVHQPLTGNVLGTLVPRGGAAGAEGAAAVQTARIIQQQDPTGKLVLEGAGSFCGGKDLQGVLRHPTLSLHAAWEALFVGHLSIDLKDRFLGVVDGGACQIDIALKD